jgi:CheY-like chemotaxis protein
MKQILMVGPSSLCTAVGLTAADHPVTACTSALDALASYTRQLRNQNPPRMVVTELALDDLTGREFVHALRAVERGLGAAPVPILAYAAEPGGPKIAQFVETVGHMVHLQRPVRATPAEQALRLNKGLASLLAQLGTA